VRRFIAVSGIFAFGNFTIGLFILRVSEVSGGVAAGLVAYIAFNIVSMAASVPAGNLSDKYGRRPLVAAGFALFAGACLAFAFVNSFGEAIAAFLVYGIFKAVWDASSRSYLGDICPKNLRATALGAHGTVIGLLTLPGSVVAATLWTLFDAPAAAFLFGAALAMASWAAFFAVKPQTPPAASA
jgi:MFS family permease